MLLNFLFFNVFHFSVSVFAALTFFAAGCLYLDAWNLDKKIKSPLIRSIGFFLLAIVFITHAISLDIIFIDFASQIVLIVALILILLSLFVEPLLHPPKKLVIENNLLIFPLSLPLITFSLIPLSAMLYLLIGLAYSRKSTEGYEKQLRPAFLAFLFLASSEFVRISTFWQDSQVIFWSKMLAEYGLVWNIEHILQFLGITILAVWLWGYIRFRLNVQLFTMTIALSLIIFLITTSLFSFLLLRNIEKDTFNHLKTDSNVLQYTLERLQSEVEVKSRAIAVDSDFKESFSSNNKEALYILSSNLAKELKLSFVTVASTSGEVVLRTEDKEKSGDTLSEDPIIKLAFSGKTGSSITLQEGIVAPEVQIVAATPILIDKKIMGIVFTGYPIDSAFVDGVKKATSLDTTIFGQDKRAATTFLAPDGSSRLLGTTETNKEILKTVLEKGEVYVGANSVLNQPFYAAYSPLKAADGQIKGMLFVGKLQTTLFETANSSIQYTFLGSIILMLLSLIPAYFIARYIKDQIEA